MAFKFGLDIDEQVAKWSMTMEDASLLGMTELSAEETAALGLGGRKSIKIPYYGLDGKPTGALRVRFLDSKKPKYSQQRGSDPRAYYPPTYNWKDLPDDATVLITEGEAKAARAAKDGIPCIGLGGVWSFKCTRTGEFEILDELRELSWKGRRVLIVFDSDIVEKPQVANASHALAWALSGRGARPETAVLPEGPNGSKTGLDDYLGRGGKVEELEVTTFAELRPLLQLNQEYQAVNDPTAIRCLKTGKLYYHRKWTDQVVSNRYTLVRKVINKEGEAKLVKTKIGTLWLGWEGRNQAVGIGYKPGGPETLPDGRTNGWIGWGTNREHGITIVEPKQNDVMVDKYWGGLMGHLFGDELKGRHWFESWCAYPFAHPGERTRQAPVIWGGFGTGKNTAATVLRNAHGIDNSITVTQKQLHGRWTGWKRGRSLIHANEITGSDKREHADALKEIITDPKVNIELKGFEEFEVDNYAEVFFTSNSAKAVWIEGLDDRRYFVHKTPKKPISAQFCKEAVEWSETVEGIAAMLHYFIHFAETHQNISGYAPNVAPMMTAAKRRMVAAGETETDTFAREAIAEARAQAALEKPVAGSRSAKELLLFRELLVKYKAEHEKDLSHPGALAASLRKFGAENVGRPSRTHNGACAEAPARGAAWAVDGHDYWEGLGDAKIAAALGWKTGEPAGSKASTVAANEDGEAQVVVAEGANEPTMH